MGAVEPPLNPDPGTDGSPAADLAEIESRLSEAAGPGRYRVVARVGAGGMGIVYKAIDTRLNRAVAIKAVLASRALPDATQRLRKEARIAASLDHPYICRVYELVQTPHEQLIVMEFVEGETLAALLKRGALPLSTTMQMGLEIAEGLANAHQHGLVHRDLKPANIMVTPHGHIKLLDFGLARVDLSSAPTGESQSTGQSNDAFAGTPHYMAPEQAGGQTVSHHADLFALGVVLFECVTGRLPFSGADRIEYLARLRSEPAMRVQHAAPATPGDLARLIDACLEGAPANRPASAGVIVGELRRLAGASSTSSGVGAATARRAPAFWAVAATLGVAAAVAVGWLWLMPESPPAAIWKSRPLVTASRDATHSRISPDRKWISYLSTRGNESQVLVKRVDGGEAQRVVLAAGAVLDQTWSADGSELIVALRQGTSVVLQVVPAFFGGAPTRTIPLTWRADELRLRRVLNDAGSLKTAGVVFVEVTEIGNRALHRVDLDRGTTASVSGQWKSPGRFLAFAVSPDARQVAYASSADGQEDLWLTDMDGGSARRLTNDTAFERFPLWLGASIVYQSNRGGQIDLWQIAVDSGASRQLTSSRDAEMPESSSVDGSLVTFALASDDSHLWTLGTGGGAAAQLTHDALSDFSPSYAPSRARVVFERSSPTPLGGARTDSILFSASLDGAGALSPPRTVADGFNAVLSPDGSLLAYLRRGPEPGATLSVMRLETNEIVTVSTTVRRPAYSQVPVEWAEQNFAWNASSGELYFIDGPNRGAIRRYQPGSHEPAATLATARSGEAIRDLYPSPDGRSLTYVVADAAVGRRTRPSTLHIMDIASGRDQQVASIDGPNRVHLRGWLPGDGGLVALQPRRFYEDLTADVEVFVVSSAGVRRSAGVIPNAWIATTRLDSRARVLYVTRSEAGIHNLSRFALDGAVLTRVTDNTQPGVTFSGIVPLSGGALLGVRSEHKSDIWMMEREPGGAAGVR
jgi:Tol biopolymer transport system component/predicted Ser/Thr protein kinase